MNDSYDVGRSSPSASDSKDPGTFVSWTEGIGDDKKSHVVHVDPDGLTWALGLKKPEEFGQIVGESKARPTEASALIEAHSRGRHVPREELDRVTFAESLNQLTVVDTAGKKQHIASGSEGEQSEIFDAVNQYLGGSASEEDADVWSVTKGPLLGLALVGGIGGLMIFLAAESDPNYEATGRRSGMKQLINWLGYTVGPTWTTVLVAAIGLPILATMVFRLVRRPQRQVLSF